MKENIKTKIIQHRKIRKQPKSLRST